MSEEKPILESIAEPINGLTFIEKVTAQGWRVIRSREVGIALVLLLAAAYLSFSTTTFLTIGNLSILARQISLTAIIGVGMTMVILLGDIDLSVGSVVALATVVTGFLIVKVGVPFPIGVLAGLLVGALIGFLNGRAIIHCYVRYDGGCTWICPGYHEGIVNQRITIYILEIGTGLLAGCAHPGDCFDSHCNCGSYIP